VRETLESVKWADEILVVDSYSTDETLDVCRNYGARIVQNAYVNQPQQQNWAVPQCRYEWVFQIDSDELLSPGMREEVEEAIATVPPNVDAFRMPRANHVLGRWLRHGGLYPDYQTRLFRRDKGRWMDRQVHAHLIVPGEVRTLQHQILHHGMPYIGRQLRNLDRYTRYEANELRKRGAHFRGPHLVVRPCLVFLHRYLWLQGFRDGWRGFIFSAYVAIYDFLARARFWEMEELGLEWSPQ
jgi:glycosyltransferase involved in cell wall biosynthesis